jgi:hypothetical protein
MATILGSTTLALWTFKVEVTEGNYSIGDNTSPVTIEFFIGRGESKSFLGSPDITLTAKIDGVGTKSLEYAPNRTINISAYAWHSMGSITFTVPHDYDGSKRINVSAGFTNDVSPSSGSATGTVELSTIPRASSLDFTDEFSVGDTVTFAVNRAVDTFTHKLYLQYGAQQYLVAEGITDSYEWDSGAWDGGKIWEVAKDTSPGESVFGMFFFYTFNGTKNIGYKSYPFTAYVPESYKGEPVVPVLSVVVSPDNVRLPLDPVLADNYISTKSLLKADFAGSTYNTAIGFGSFEIGITGGQTRATETNASKTIVTSKQSIMETGAKEVYCILTDKSGRKVTKTFPIGIEPYAAPSVAQYDTSPFCQRVKKDDNGIWQPNKRGEAILIKAKRSYESLEGANKCELLYDIYDDNGESIYGELQYAKDEEGNDMTFDSADDYADFVVGGSDYTFDMSKTYSVALYARDLTGEEGRITASVPVATPTFHAPRGGNGFALGMTYGETEEGKEEGRFLSNYAAYFYNGIKIPVSGGWSAPDYIKFFGVTDDGWNYIEYSNGVAEAWGYLHDEMAVETSGYGMYSGLGQLHYLPFTPVGDIAISSIGVADSFVGSPKVVATHPELQFRHYRNASTTEIGRNFYVYIKGFWKNPINEEE